MKSLIAAFRPLTAGQSLVQGMEPVDEPSSEDQLGEGGEKPSGPPQPGEATDRAPHPTRLRAILTLALLSWIVIAFIAYAILRF